jgi:hypothetical protein
LKRATRRLGRRASSDQARVFPASGPAGIGESGQPHRAQVADSRHPATVNPWSASSFHCVDRHYIRAFAVQGVTALHPCPTSPCRRHLNRWLSSHGRGPRSDAGTIAAGSRSFSPLCAGSTRADSQRNDHLGALQEHRSQHPQSSRDPGRNRNSGNDPDAQTTPGSSSDATTERRRSLTLGPDHRPLSPRRRTCSTHLFEAKASCDDSVLRGLTTTTTSHWSTATEPSCTAAHPRRRRRLEPSARRLHGPWRLRGHADPPWPSRPAAGRPCHASVPPAARCLRSTPGAGPATPRPIHPCLSRYRVTAGPV